MRYFYLSPVDQVTQANAPLKQHLTRATSTHGSGLGLETKGSTNLVLSCTRVYESRPPNRRSGTVTAATAGGSDISLPSSVFLPPPAPAMVTPKSDVGAATTIAPFWSAEDEQPPRASGRLTSNDVPALNPRVIVIMPKLSPVLLQSLNDGNDPTSAGVFVVAAGPCVDGRHPDEIGRLFSVSLVTTPRFDCAAVLAGAVSGFLVDRGGSDGTQTGARRSRSSLNSTTFQTPSGASPF